MSPLPAFRVTLMVGRTLSLVINARNAQAAEDIATYVYSELGADHLSTQADAVLDVIVTREGAPS